MGAAPAVAGGVEVLGAVVAGQYARLRVPVMRGVALRAALDLTVLVARLRLKAALRPLGREASPARP